MDQKLTSGKLNNGLTYYICENPFPEQKAIFGLTVRVGCVVEEIHQRGIAHFIEHMCLAGVLGLIRENKNYQDHQNYIDTFGYTNFDETVYKLECSPLPNNIIQSIDHFGQIADGSAIKPLHLETVRKKVVTEYSKTVRKTDYKIRSIVLPQLLDSSDYAKLMPIGELECIKKFNYPALREFHREWYKPELMAVIAVGAFDSTKLETLIIDSFSGLNNYTGTRVRNYSNIPPYTRKKWVINYFKELEHSELNLYCIYQRYEIKTDEDFKLRLIDAMSCLMTKMSLKHRFREEAIEIDDLICIRNRFLHLYEFSVITIKTNDKITTVLPVMLEQLEELAVSGFAAADWESCKDSFRRMLEASFIRSSQCQNVELYSECINHFLYKDPIFSLQYEYELNLRLIDEICLDDLKGCQKLWLENQNTAIILNLPETQRNQFTSVGLDDYLTNWSLRDYPIEINNH